MSALYEDRFIVSYLVGQDTTIHNEGGLTREQATTRYAELLERSREPRPDRIHGLYLLEVVRDWKVDTGIGMWTQRGTGLIPTINANGSQISPSLCDRLLDMVKGLSGLEVEMHPEQQAAIESLAIRISAALVAKGERPLAVPLEGRMTFGGFPIVLSTDSPHDVITLRSRHRATLAGGERAEPMIVARMVNIGLPCYQTP